MFRFRKLAVVCCGIAFLHIGRAQASWVSMPYGATTMPQNAMVAGKYFDGSLVYACQASYMGGVHSGWTVAGKGACSIGWGSQEVALPSFSIWQNDWAPASNGSVPGNALAFGSEMTTAPPPALNFAQQRYACIGNNTDPSGTPEGGTSSGKAATDLGACLFGWGLEEIHQPNYSVLVDYAFNSYQQGWYTAEVAGFTGNSPLGFYQPVGLSNGQPVPYDAILAAKEADGSPLYLCNANLNGYQIGKAHWNSCDISYGGGEYYMPSYNVLIPYWTQYSGGAFPYQTQVPNDPANGYETGVASGSENGAQFYLCRAPVDPLGAVVLTGKVNQNVGSCSIAYNGTEHWIGTYQVLTDRYTLAETVVR